MFCGCYNYKNARINEAVKLLEKAIYKDNYKYMFDIVKYTEGLHVNYIFKTTLLKKNYKMSLINFAARCDSCNCISILLKNCANINTYDGMGWLPIHYAAIYHEVYRNKSLLALLTSQYVNIHYLTKGGKKNQFNNVKLNTKGKTAYQLANHYLCYGSCKIINNYIKNKQKKIPIASMAKPYYD